MRKCLILGILLAAFSVFAAETIHFAGTEQDWADDLIDTMTFVHQGPWGGVYDVVQIQPLDVDQAKVLGKDASREAAVEAAKKMDGWCQKALRETYGLKGPHILKEGEETVPGKRVALLRWRCVEIDPGSRAKRFWVGFGAGHGGVALAGEVVDKATGEVLVTFTHRRVNGVGFAITGGRYMKVLAHSAVWTANDIGEMLGIILRTSGVPEVPAREARPVSRPDAP